ncbi:glyoxalase [Schumannella luteola]|uniref:Catechol 2,3-dioxygenase-like lactoylglutathione lyase family enzyme n=1 Tax=Schumannella luteola TaxID=472059 RepID=A0A852YFA2_9MICO|nr:VOC family protein [Schumannella luteola]NYG97768.1 catechol 2,3-dioxygenase-like lactoylglutathione lyase family enzyme [Schumannella luteola]TPX02097.1 glyoxalase [Schumannella luteola]
MQIQFIAGYGPIGPDPAATRRFWGDVIGLELDEIAPDYFHARDLDGAKVFGLWPLSQAAEATFGTAEWPADLPVPQSWIEFELESPEAVAAGAAELAEKGQRILVGPKVEPWGQSTARLLSPEGILVGLSYLPSFHES